MTAKLKNSLPVVILVALAGVWFPLPEGAHVAASRAALPARSWVLSDVDGDSRPEIATSRADGYGFDSLEITFSSAGRRIPLLLPAPSLAVRVYAYDIDHDNDQDLIVASSAGVERITVWLNDGEGHFVKGERWSGTHFLQRGSTATVESLLPESDSAALCSNDRMPLDRSFATTAPAPPAGNRFPCGVPSFAARLLEKSIPARGPPISCPV